MKLTRILALLIALLLTIACVPATLAEEPPPRGIPHHDVRRNPRIALQLHR